MKDTPIFDPHHRLACGIVGQALRDWRDAGDPGALAWLWAEGAAWLELLEQPHPRQWESWLLTDCASGQARRLRVRMVTP